MISHAIHVDAPVERLWELTLDIERWPDITPTISSVRRLDDEPIRVGSQARVKQPGQRSRTWTVTRVDAPHRFEWEAPLAWTTMTAIHEISADDGGSTNTLTLAVRGFGRRVVMLLLGIPLRRALAAENLGFKAAAEPPATVASS